MGLTENTPTALLALIGLGVRPNSAVSVEGMEAGLVGEDQKVAVLAPAGSREITGFEGESSAVGDRTLVLGPTNAANLDVLRGLPTRLRTPGSWRHSPGTIRPCSSGRRGGSSTARSACDAT